MNPRTDAELVAACLSGDTAAWDALIARYQNFIYGLPLRMGLSAADAEDVFQNTCLKLFQHLGELHDVQRLSGWLAAIIRQEVWGLWRRRGSQPLSDLPEGGQMLESARPLGAEPAPSPEELILNYERQHLVRLGVQELSEECRKLLTLLYGEEAACSYAEVAQRLSIPLGSIGPKRARCLERLRKNLEKFGY